MSLSTSDAVRAYVRGQVAKIGSGRLHAGGKRALRLIGGISGSHLGKQLHPDEQRHNDRESDGKRTKTPH